jgi:NDP-sugar pyrophosphorylase family protein
VNGRGKAVILAGGHGTRLRPYTTVLPKPLMPIGDRAILEIMVEQLRLHGFTDLVFTVGYLAHLLQAVFNGGERHGVSISYHVEAQPLGTAGPLGAITDIDDSFLFMVGDVLTTLDYGALYDAHRESGAILTVATYPRIVPVDFGVLHLSGGPGAVRQLVRYEEKPDLNYFVSMGIYAAEPRILGYIKRDQPLDLPQLVDRLTEAGEKVSAFVHDGYWLDIGRREDYEQAVEDLDARWLVTTHGNGHNGNEHVAANGNGHNGNGHVAANGNGHNGHGHVVAPADLTDDLTVPAAGPAELPAL